MSRVYDSVPDEHHIIEQKQQLSGRNFTDKYDYDYVIDDDDDDDDNDEYDDDDDDDYDYDDDYDEYGDKLEDESPLQNEDMMLTRKEFNKAKAITVRTLSICQSMSNDDQLVSKVREMARDIDPTHYDSSDFYQSLKVLLCKDILYCYRHLGLDDDIDFYTPEGQLLLPVTLLLTDVNENNTYLEFRQEMLSEDDTMLAIRDCHEEMFNVLKNSNVNLTVEGMDDFSLVMMVKVMNREQLYLKELRSELYKMACLIANVAGMDDHKRMALKELKQRAEEDEKDHQRTDDEENTVSPQSAIEDLESLVGLRLVKKEIKELRNFIEVNKRREEAGLKTPQVSYHCVFTGNPGTGKTTVARIVAGIYKDLGILKKGQLVETDRSGLVAEYVGQTAVKTNKIIDSALDGVLFIDEAYSLVGAGKEDFGKEAIATLVKRMEDDRDRLVVILAGYQDEMERFIESNPGLRSRFNRFIHFEDYTADELRQIYLNVLQRYDFKLQSEGEQVLARHLAECVARKGKDFGNARYMRNLFERSIKAQAVRLSLLPDADKAQLAMITADDIAAAIVDNP